MRASTTETIPTLIIAKHTPLDLPKTTPKQREPGSPITDVGDDEIRVDGTHV